ncbi:hypothetical protein TNCV_3640991 [Trichonephila clavipes]|nr:hypothetical protein TNCV_3640991 [Trichonephila clavipes]
MLAPPSKGYRAPQFEKHWSRWLATLTAVPLGLDSNPGENMDVCKFIVPSRYGVTLNNRRVPSPLVRLMDGEERLFFFSPSRSKAKTVHSSALFLVYRVLCVRPPSVLCATPAQRPKQFTAAPGRREEEESGT